MGFPVPLGLTSPGPPPARGPRARETEKHRVSHGLLSFSWGGGRVDSLSRVFPPPPRHPQAAG